MTESQRPKASNGQDSFVEIEQNLRGDRNQTIGQVMGGIVVYGQAIIHSGADALSVEANKSEQSDIGPNPYKGLLAFQETDGDRFFGRDAQIEQIWQQFRQLHELDKAIRLLPIYGPSGSGKSSLARAGLIPELAKRPLPGRDRARVAVLVPGTHPLEALATVLARVAKNDPIPVAKTREFRAELAQANADENYDGLRRIADALPDIAVSPLIVLVDQLEELYTLCEDRSERTAFVQNILYAAADRAKRVSVIVTMRSDFLGETQKQTALNSLFAEQGFLVRSMNESELREAISKPATLAGKRLDESTVSLLVEQTEDREGTLPLLQFALSRIWDGLQAGVKPAVTLDKIGGVGGALAGEAERVYQSLDVGQQAIARRLFLGLVQLGEGTRDTRRRVEISSLISHKEDPTTVKQVLEKFAAPAERLITCAANGEGIDTAEVTHEALFDHWQLLQKWLEDGRSDLRFQRRLEAAAADWDEMGRPEGKLWRSPDLDLLYQYYEQSSDSMSALYVDFFSASKRAVEQAQKEKTRQQRRLIGVLSAGLTFTTGTAAFAMYQVQRFERQRVEQLATTAEALLLSGQPLEAKIHAIAATGASKSTFVQFLRPWPFPSAYASLLNARRANAEQNQLRGHKDWVSSVAVSPDGKMIVSGSYDNTVRLWDAITGNPIGKPLNGHKDAISSVSFSPDGKMLVSGSWDRTVRLWDASSGNPIGEPFNGQDDAISSVAVSPDGKTIITVGDSTKVRLWDVSTRISTSNPLNEYKGSVSSLSFSPDGKMIVSGSYDNTVRLWDAATGKPIGGSLKGHKASVESVAFSPDGKAIASGSSDKTVRLWDAVTGEPIGEPLKGHEASVRSVAFSLDGKMIVSGSDDTTVRLWDVATVGALIGKPLSEREIWANSVAFSPDGKTIATGSEVKTVQLWDVTTKEPIGKPLNGHKNEVTSVAFSSDGTMIASESLDNTVRLWDATAGKSIDKPLNVDKYRVNSVAFSPDGKMIVSGNGDHTVRLWDVTSRKPIGKPVNGHENAVNSVAFSPDGKTIVSGSYDNMVRLWDVTTREPIGKPLKGHGASVNSVAFSLDGKMIVSGSSDKTVRLWDAITGEPIGEPLKGHEASVRSVAFSFDGKTIVSGSDDTTVRLWDVTTKEPIGKPLKDHESWVDSVAFSPNGMIASGSGDNTVRLWDISQKTLLQRVCNQLRGHPVLTIPATDVEKEANRTCDRYVWSKEKPSSTKN